MSGLGHSVLILDSWTYFTAYFSGLGELGLAEESMARLCKLTEVSGFLEGSVHVAIQNIGFVRVDGPTYYASREIGTRSRSHDLQF